MLKAYFAELDLESKVSFARNGQEVINLVKEIFNESLASEIESGNTFKPIDLLILDFQMPNKNGLQVYSEIKQFYAAQKSNIGNLDV